MTEPVTFTEQYTSLKFLYRQMMFPKEPHAPKWTMAEIDQLDVHFFYDLLDLEEGEAPQSQEEDVYLAAIW